MKELAKDRLQNGNLWRNIWLFSFPLILSNLLQVFFNISDIAVIGRFGSSESLGAVGSSTNLINLFTFFIIGMGCGINVTVARFIGTGEKDKIKKAVHSGFLVCLLAGIAICALILFSGNGILRLLKTRELFFGNASLYVKVYAMGMPGMAIFNFSNAVFSAYGDTKRPLIFLASSGVLNLCLNLFFVIVCHMDVLGVALASCLSSYVAAGLCIGAMMRNRDVIRFRFRDLHFDRDNTRQIILLGFSAGLQNALFAIANLFIQAGVNSFGDITVEGIATAQNADALVWDTMAAFYTAASSFIGQNYGANRRDRVKKTYFITTFYSFAIGALLGGLLLLCNQPFLSLFTKDAAVAQAGKERLVVMAFSYCVSAFMDNTIAASRGLGKSVVPTFIVIMGSVFFRIAWVYTVFAYFGTVTSLFLLYVFSWSITAVFEILYFFYTYKKAFSKLEKPVITPED